MIESRNPASTTELLRSVAGLHVIQQGGRGSVTNILIRGAEPNFTVVLVDGMRVNDSTNTRGGSYDFSYLDVNSIERVEIIRGPMSALYGSDSLGGIISLTTRSDADGVKASAEIGGFDYRAVHATAGFARGRANGNLSINATNDQSGVPGSDYEDLGLNASLRFTATERSNVGLNARFLDAESAGFPEDSGGPLLAVLRDIDVRDVTEMQARLFAEHTIREDGKIQFSFGRFERKESYDSPGIASEFLTVFRRTVRTHNLHVTSSSSATVWELETLPR